MATFPSAILVKGQIVRFDSDERQMLSSRAAGWSFHQLEDYGLMCYEAAKQYALAHRL